MCALLYDPERSGSCSLDSGSCAAAYSPRVVFRVPVTVPVPVLASFPAPAPAPASSMSAAVVVPLPQNANHCIARVLPLGPYMYSPVIPSKLLCVSRLHCPTHSPTWPTRRVSTRSTRSTQHRRFKTAVYRVCPRCRHQRATPTCEQEPLNLAKGGDRAATTETMTTSGRCCGLGPSSQ